MKKTCIFNLIETSKSENPIARGGEKFETINRIVIVAKCKSPSAKFVSSMSIHSDLFL